MAGDVATDTGGERKPSTERRQGKRGAASVEADERPSSQGSPPRRAERYRAAFPEASLDMLRAHLEVVGTGRVMSRAVAKHLSEQFDVHTARYSLMRALYFAPDGRLPQNQVAREMGTSPPNITYLLDGLERDGLVERVVNADNRRVTYAQLTPEGETMCEQMLPSMVAFMQESVEVLSPEEASQLIGLLSKLREHLRTYLPDEE